jgi:hypothetical protein
MWLVGTAYNWCWTHDSLRLRAIGGRKWQERTPAMVAGLTDHAWTMEEVLRYRVLPVEAAPPRCVWPPNVISLARRRRAKARATEAVA